MTLSIYSRTKSEEIYSIIEKITLCENEWKEQFTRVFLFSYRFIENISTSILLIVKGVSGLPLATYTTFKKGETFKDS